MFENNNAGPKLCISCHYSVVKVRPADFSPSAERADYTTCPYACQGQRHKTPMSLRSHRRGYRPNELVWSSGLCVPQIFSCLGLSVVLHRRDCLSPDNILLSYRNVKEQLIYFKIQGTDKSCMSLSKVISFVGLSSLTRARPFS